MMNIKSINLLDLFREQGWSPPRSVGRAVQRARSTQ